MVRSIDLHLIDYRSWTKILSLLKKHPEEVTAGNYPIRVHQVECYRVILFLF